MKRVEHPPKNKSLRTLLHPLGVKGFKGKEKARLERDAKTANLYANGAGKIQANGKTFSLEHLRRSIALGLKSWEKLYATEAVIVTHCRACMSAPRARRKSQR